MKKQRVVCFIDGFNLYHSIKNLNRAYLKWVNLWSLSSVFIRPNSQELVDVFYFSAFPNWLPESKKRHKKYIKALEFFNVSPIMGRFKNKDRKCPHCCHRWYSHEEKETDVNIALSIVNLAYKNAYEHAFVISNDSDLAPAIRMVRQNHPQKEITTIVPPNYFHSNELIKASSAKAKLKIKHLERCLLPNNIFDSRGKLVVSCPEEYVPLNKRAPNKNSLEVALH